jgi:hypothetical protein
MSTTPSFVTQMALHMADDLASSFLPDCFNQVTVEGEHDIWFDTSEIVFFTENNQREVAEMVCGNVMYLAWRGLLEQHAEIPELLRLKTIH